METYLIVRRSGWRSTAELAVAAERSRAACARMPNEVGWIRTYALSERDGSVGTVCVYQAASPEAIRRHAADADLPVDEIVKVADTLVVLPDPSPKLD